jgi:AcrR family transcriptional regulator
MNHIVTKGFEELRFLEVANEGDINNATLYYYFRTREALILRSRSAPAPRS